MTERDYGLGPGCRRAKASSNNPAQNQHNTGSPPDPESVSRPVIGITRGELGEVVRAAARALQETGADIYLWGDRLVRLARLEDDAPDTPVHRDPAMQLLRPVVPGWLLLRLADTASWWRWDIRAQEWWPSDPPPRVPAMMVDAGDELGFPVLRARAACPQLLNDGRIQGHGYHPDSGLLVDAPGEWPAPPEAPTWDDAASALNRLRELYRYYPWATPAAESAALSALITACIRPTLPAAPGYGVGTPLSGAGTGKSLLARSISMIATGRAPTVITWPDTPGEGAKRLDATHLAGDLIVSIDNVSRPLEDDALCAALTEPMRDIRPLGGSITLRTPMVALHLVTGNALTIRGDLTRRMVPIVLDPRTDRPDQRAIPQDLIAESRTRRSELLHDVHTILRAYLAAGEPDMRLRATGEYREWTRRVRAPLVWLGLTDPASTQETLRADDPQRAARVALITAWYRAFGGAGATAREAIEAVSDPLGIDGLPVETREALRDAIEAVALRRGKVDNGALGRWLRAARDARVGELVLSGEAVRGGRVRWIVQRNE